MLIAWRVARTGARMEVPRREEGAKATWALPDTLAAETMRAAIVDVLGGVARVELRANGRRWEGEEEANGHLRVWARSYSARVVFIAF